MKALNRLIRAWYRNDLWAMCLWVTFTGLATICGAIWGESHASGTRWVLAFVGFFLAVTGLLTGRVPESERYVPDADEALRQRMETAAFAYGMGNTAKAEMRRDAPPGMG